jgi:imidazolonepropionase-like amidohydrolase
MRTAIKTAQELGLWSTVHIDNDRHARMAVEAGARSIEHLPPDLSDETIKEMLRGGTTLTPTLIASKGMLEAMTGTRPTDPLVLQWVDPVILESLSSPNSWIAKVRSSHEAVGYYANRFEQQKAALRRAVSAGVRIVAGSDAGNPAVFHGPALIQELELMVEEGGMTPAAAIDSATVVAAKRLGREDVGQIAPGAFADFIILPSDPKKDIRALRNIRDVYFEGLLLQRDQLLTTRPGNWHPIFSFPTTQSTKK